MKDSEEKSGFFFHVSCFVREHFRGVELCKLVADLEGHPDGLRRSVSLFYLDAYVCNNGFEGLFFNRFGCLASGAIEGYLRIESLTRARIIRTAVDLCHDQEPSLASVNCLELSPYATSAQPLPIESTFDPLKSKFDQLDRLYYAEKDLLPGAGRFKSQYPLGAIDWYAEKYPEDFPANLLARGK